MILAITERYGLSEKGTEKYYIDKEFKDIFEKLNVLLFPVSSLTNLEEVVDICDGLIVIGSAIDVNPKNYGEQPIKEIHKKTEEIDTLDFAMIKKFNDVNKPILGICRGIQAINVFFGGSLYQDIPNHKLPRNERHNVKFEKDSFLYDCYKTEQMQINSLHHQAIKTVAKGFKVVAKSEDGIVEGIENKNIIAVQWHPEYMNDMKFFEYFVNKISNKDH